MRSRIWPFAAVVLVSFALAGCSPRERARGNLDVPVQSGVSPKPSDGERIGDNESWLTDENVERTIQRQMRTAAGSMQARLDHINHLLTLRERADILLELRDQEFMRLLSSRVLTNLPTNNFPIGDLQRYLTPNSANHNVDLVAIISPSPFSEDEGKPTQLDLFRAIDKVLREHGVKRRVFQSSGSMDVYQLDSESEENYK